MVNTKIIATLGPASSSAAVLTKMYRSGLDIARLNFSHGDHAEHIRRIMLVRLLNRKMRRAIKIMMDLEGYRIRIGRLKAPLTLKKNYVFYLTRPGVIGSKLEVPFDYTGPFGRIKPGAQVLIDDGKIILEVKHVFKERIRVKVIVPGALREHKGVNIPELKLSHKGLTPKDEKDLKVAARYKPDYVAQSFVKDAKDVVLLRKALGRYGAECEVFAKIESRQAVANIDEIIEESDGIIVARGDLGVCVPIYTVPEIQKDIIKKCLNKNRPVVVATQMLDSMTESPIPTRAEVSDVANAIFDGATHLLLSGETSIGRHPHKVVGMMNKIIKSAEQYRMGSSLPSRISRTNVKRFNR